MFCIAKPVKQIITVCIMKHIIIVICIIKKINIMFCIAKPVKQIITACVMKNVIIVICINKWISIIIFIMNINILEVLYCQFLLFLDYFLF